MTTASVNQLMKIVNDLILFRLGQMVQLDLLQLLGLPVESMFIYNLLRL